MITISVYRDKCNGYNGTTWRASVSYVDWQGNRKKHDKRGFATKKDALAYVEKFRAKVSKNINMSFDSFIDVYLEDKSPRLKESTVATKENIIDTHIRPYFQNKSLSEITQTDILYWKNRLLSARDANGRPYSPTFLRTIENQINAIFNHAVRYYDLPKNPCLATERMGRHKAKEMLFWTKEEYLKFAKELRESPMAYYIFQLLYWTGIRSGELLALTKADFDLSKGTLRINKTYQVVKGKELITSPKTEKGNRIIELPQFLCDEMQDYFEAMCSADNTSRIFPVSKHFLHYEMDVGAKKAGVKRIRIHDLRHSSCALLIELGYSTIQIAERLGHESASVTEMYAHLYPSVQRKMADRLNDIFNSKGTEE